MRKLIIVVASLMVLVLFIFQGFQQTFPVPETAPGTESSEYTGEGIDAALNEIYYNVSIMGVEDATAERLASDFEIDTSCFSAVYGRYTNGRFGIADVIIVIPTPGEEAAARDAQQGFGIRPPGNTDQGGGEQLADAVAAQLLPAAEEDRRGCPLSGGRVCGNGKGRLRQDRFAAVRLRLQYGYFPSGVLV
jgi:hypothetical protein